MRLRELLDPERVLVVLMISPLAYFIRQKRQGLPQRSGARRGAERTPLLPQNEEIE
jgi:hypothetical protein